MRTESGKDLLLDLKLGKLMHQDLGPMRMYLSYFDRYQRESHAAPTIGIVLCSDKNDTMVCDLSRGIAVDGGEKRNEEAGCSADRISESGLA